MKKNLMKNQCWKKVVRAIERGERPGTGILPLGPGELPINKINNKLIKENNKRKFNGGWCAKGDVRRGNAE